MRRIGGNIRVAGLAAIVSMVAFMVLLASGQVAAAPAQESVVATGLPLGNSLIVPGVESLVGGQREAAELAKRANPETVVGRQRSRTAYEHVGPAAAAQLARQVLPAVVAPAPSGLGSMPAGAHIGRYLNTNAAQVILANGKRALVDSLTPIATSISPGRYGPVDLGLRRSGEGFVPVKPAVNVRIPKSLGSGIVLPSNGVSLTPVDGSGRPLQGRGELDGATILYANSQTDADTAVKATSTGFEAYNLLRSVESPQEVSYRVGMPSGAKLVPLSHGDGGSQVVVAGHVIAVIPAPSAEDAAGTSVPITTEISGRTLHVRVAHRAGDYSYPIAVDPTVEDNKLLEATRNWRFEHSGSHFKAELEGSIGEKYWDMSIDSAHLLNEWGAWEYPTQGESHIYELSTQSQGAQAASNIEAKIGIFNSAGWEASTTMPTSFLKTPTTVCVASCSSSGGSAANLATFWATAIGTGTSAFYNLYTASVYIAQTNGPSVSPNTTSEKIGARTNALYGSGSWMSKTQSAIEFKMSDPGVGVHGVEFIVPAEGKKWTNSWACTVQCPPSGKETLGYIESGVQHLPDGEPTLEVKATNSMGSSATTSVKVKVDGTAPYELSLAGVPGGGQVGDAYRALKLTAKAKDGSGTTVSSGIASLNLKIDGQQIGSPSGSCSPGPCTATAEWTINAEEYGAGKHVLSFTATDKAGNVTNSTETPIVIHHASPTPVGPGKVNPVSGEFELEESDVSVPTADKPLTVTRSYSSRQPGAGSEGPLGSPWNISFGGAQELVQMANGSLVLSASDGSQATFVNKGSGHYDPPAGDAGMSITYKEDESEYGVFILEDRGAQTTFTHVSEDSENTWRPTVSTSTGGTSAVTYSYRVTGGVVEPVEALGPVPAGVSCTTELKVGCRALTFNYATSTTATGEGPSEWGDYTGRLTRVYFTGYDTSSKTMTTTTVAQYGYDTKGRLRAVWDPRISPALKLTYGYDAEGRVTSLNQPGREPWLFAYGTTASDTSPGRLVAAGRPVASTALGSGKTPVNTKIPRLTEIYPGVGKALSVLSGTWSESPLRYGYQWERCDSSGSNCVVIGGAINREYKPTSADLAKTLRARVTATNSGGAVASTTPVSAAVTSSGFTEPQQLSTFGSAGTGNGQLNNPWGIARDANGNVWVADTGNNRVEEFNSEGSFVRVAGTSGSGILQAPEDVTTDSAGNAWVTDTQKSRVVEFNASGVYVRAFGTAGTGNGQFNMPWGITVDSANHVWVVDAGNDRVQEFTTEGTFIRSFGSEGAGNGQFKAPERWHPTLKATCGFQTRGTVVSRSSAMKACTSNSSAPTAPATASSAAYGDSQSIRPTIRFGWRTHVTIGSRSSMLLGNS